MVHSEDQGEVLEHDQVAGELRDAGNQVEEVNPEDNVVETAREGQEEILEVNINDGSKTIFGAGDNPLLGKGVVDTNEMTDEKVVGEKCYQR